MVRKRKCWVLPSSAPLPTPGPTAATRAFPWCSQHHAPWLLWGYIPETGLLCSEGACRGTPPPTQDSDLITGKCPFCLRRLERLVLTSSSYKSLFPRLGPITEKTQSPFWQELKFSESSLCSSIPQFPFSRVVLVTTSHPHKTKINACKLHLSLLHVSAQRSLFCAIAQYNYNIKYHNVALNSEQESAFSSKAIQGHLHKCSAS